MNVSNYYVFARSVLILINIKFPCKEESDARWEGTNSYPKCRTCQLVLYIDEGKETLINWLLNQIEHTPSSEAARHPARK